MKTVERGKPSPPTALTPCAAVLSILSLALLPACSTSLSAKRARGGANQPEPYVRVSTSDSNRVQLQIAVRKFLPRRRNEPVVWLTGVCHIGESNYFARLQNHLEAQSLVLFEGISGPPPEHHQTSASRGNSENDPPSTEKISASRRASLQTSVATSLGLVFQLEVIDYTSPHFRNSDLSLQELRRLMTDSKTPAGQESAGKSFETLVKIMEGESIFDSIIRMALGFVGANPKLQGLGKLTLIETIAQMKGDPSQLRGLPPQMNQLLEVLLEKRNEKVLHDLKEMMRERNTPKSIAIFYGTGHMPDLEARLCRELKYRSAEDLWLTAFSVDLAKSAITQNELQFIRAFVKREMDQLQTPK